MTSYYTVSNPTVDPWAIGKPVQFPGTEGGLAFEADKMPEGLEPTHVLMGFGGQSYVPIPIDQTQYGVIAAIFVLVIVILLMLAYGYYRSWSSVRMSYVPKRFIWSRSNFRDTLESRVGAAARRGYISPYDGTAFGDETTCSANPTSHWNKGRQKCQCSAPFYGPKCRRESYSSSFVSVGYLEGRDYTLEQIGKPISVNRLSFPVEGEVDPPPSCTELCQQNEDCKGVVWQSSSDFDLATSNGTCTLFQTLTVKPGKTVTFDPTIENNIYVREQGALQFTDRVFIYSGKLLRRFWGRGSRSRIIDRGQKRTDNLQIAFRGRVYLLTFYPTGALNQTTMTGLYSLNSFSSSDFQTLLQQGGDDVYIVQPGETLVVPFQWWGRSIWVMYEQADLGSTIRENA